MATRLGLRGLADLRCRSFACSLTRLIIAALLCAVLQRELEHSLLPINTVSPLHIAAVVALSAVLQRELEHVAERPLPQQQLVRPGGTGCCVVGKQTGSVQG